MTIKFINTPEKWDRICDLVHSYPPLAGYGPQPADPELAEKILKEIFSEIHGLKVVYND